jgi:hypothetical protein
MGISFEDNLRLRQEILDYTGRFDDAQLRGLKTADLVAHLRQSGFPDLTPAIIKDCLFYGPGSDYLDPEEGFFATLLSWKLSNEQDSLSRLEKLLGKNALKMGVDELKAAALTMFVTAGKGGYA